MRMTLTVDCKLGPVGIVGAKVVRNHTLVTALISEVDIKEVKDGGVDELSFLIASIILHFCIIQHLPILPPCSGHRRVTAAGCDAP